jgi:hypothetical protein
MHRQLNRTRDVGSITALRLETSPLPSPYSSLSDTCNSLQYSALFGFSTPVWDEMYLLLSVRHHADASAGYHSPPATESIAPISSSCLK